MDLKKILDELFEECKHGDQEHQDWLRAKFDEFTERKLKELLQFKKLEVEIINSGDALLKPRLPKPRIIKEGESPEGYRKDALYEAKSDIVKNSYHLKGKKEV